MSNTLSNLGKLRVTLPIFSQLIASSLFCAVVSSIFTPVSAQTGQINNAREAEARQYLGALTRAQQAYYLEYGTFASTVASVRLAIAFAQTPNALIEDLGVGLPQSPTYFYGIFPQDDPTQSAIVAAKPYASGVKGYISGVFVTIANGEALTIAGICETIQPGFLPGVPTLADGSVKCPEGYQTLKQP